MTKFYTVCGKMKKITDTEKKFRQINSLVTSLVETLFSRNFCQRCTCDMSVNFHNIISTL